MLEHSTIVLWKVSALTLICDLHILSEIVWTKLFSLLQVIQYTQALVDNSSCSIRYSDIGIITPYRKQVTRFFLYGSHVCGGHVIAA